MSVCPYCGAYNDGNKFCENCGAQLPDEQQVQPEQQVQAQPAPGPQPISVQPVYQEPFQPAYQQTEQPVYQQPSQPAYQQSAQPGYQQPAYMQSAQDYQPQPSYDPAPQKVTNSACIAGFVLGLTGIFTCGIPSFIGFIVSTIGVIIAFVKKQKGKVLGIIGMVLSLLMVICMILVIANSDKISDALDEYVEGQSFEEQLFDVSYEGKIEMISETEWIEKNSGSCLIFEADDNFKYYKDYHDLTNNYFTGTYEIHFGYEAMDIIEQRYSQYGYTADDICDKIEKERGVSGVKDFMVLVIHNDGCWIDGENTIDIKWDNVYMGYYDDVKQIMDLTYLENDLGYYFVSSEKYH